MLRAPGVVLLGIVVSPRHCADNGANTHSNRGEDARALKRKPDDPLRMD
jgi:hypothetical protein